MFPAVEPLTDYARMMGRAEPWIGAQWILYESGVNEQRVSPLAWGRLD